MNIVEIVGIVAIVIAGILGVLWAAGLLHIDAGIEWKERK